MKGFVLVGDVGGTNTRFALDDGVLRHVMEWPTAETPGLKQALAWYLAQVPVRPEAACVAIAGPVQGDFGSLTNADWIGRTTDFPVPGRLVNDLEAAAAGLHRLGDADRVQLVPGPLDVHEPMAVMGLGTGLGEAYRIRGFVIPGEGGHRPFAPDDEEQRELAACIRASEDVQVTWEHVLSGSGLGRILDFVRRREGAEGPTRKDLSLPELAIQATSLAETDPCCAAACALYVRCCAAEARAQALQVLARGGVWLAGGMPPRLPVSTWRQGFAEAFIGTGVMTHILRQVPVFMVTHPNPNLLGAGQIARDLLG